MIPIFPVYPAPSISGVQVHPVSPQGSVVIGIGEVYTVLKEVKINREPLPMEGIFVSIRDCWGAICVTQSNGVALAVSKINEAGNH